MDKDSILSYKMNYIEEKISKRVTNKIKTLADNTGKKYHCIGVLGDCGCMEVVYINNVGYFIRKQQDRGIIVVGVSDSDENTFIQKVLNLEMY